MQPVIHHHFQFSEALLKHPQRCKNISFESIPFFKLYKWESLHKVRSLIESMVSEMPHGYQETFNKINPKNLANCRYREDLIPMKFCTHDRQSFFVRAYYLRQHGGDFFKVEVVLHSKTLGNGKYYDYPKASQGAKNFFKILDKSGEPLNPLNLHKPEYFFPKYFEKRISGLQDHLDALRDSTFTKEREALIEYFTNLINDFQKKAKLDSFEHVSSLTREVVTQANLLNSL